MLPDRRRPQTVPKLPVGTTTVGVEGRAARVVGHEVRRVDTAAAYRRRTVGVPGLVLLLRKPDAKRRSPSGLAVVEGATPSARLAAFRPVGAPAAGQLKLLPRPVGQVTEAATPSGLPGVVKAAVAVLQGAPAARRIVPAVRAAIAAPARNAEVSVAAPDALRVGPIAHGARPGTTRTVVLVRRIAARASGLATVLAVAPAAPVELIRKPGLVSVAPTATKPLIGAVLPAVQAVMTTIPGPTPLMQLGPLASAPRASSLTATTTAAPLTAPCTQTRPKAPRSVDPK